MYLVLEVHWSCTIGGKLRRRGRGLDTYKYIQGYLKNGLYFFFYIAGTWFDVFSELLGMYGKLYDKTGKDTRA